MAEEKEYCSCKLYVRGEDLDPRQVTTILGVEPSEAYRKGEKRGGWIARTGRWRLDVDREKKWAWDAAAQLDYWCVFLTSRETAIRELQARGYEVMIDCFIDEGPVVYLDVSAELMQTFGNLGVALKFGFYNSENLQPEKKS